MSFKCFIVSIIWFKNDTDPMYPVSKCEYRSISFADRPTIRSSKSLFVRICPLTTLYPVWFENWTELIKSTSNPKT